MTTIEELAEQVKKSDDLIKQIERQLKAFTIDEFTLLDLVAAEEHFDDLLSELKETTQRIIKLREWLSFENIQNGPF